jgi:hypothetical protein
MLRLSETAPTCETCRFNYVKPTTELTAFHVYYETALSSHLITLEGSGFPTYAEGVTFLVDGVRQELQSASDSELKFKSSGLLDRCSNDVELYFEDGYSTGYDHIIVDREMCVHEYTYDIEPKVGSAGGTLLTLHGSGYGVETDTRGMEIQAVRFMDGGHHWVNICAGEVTIVESGYMTCMT